MFSACEASDAAARPKHIPITLDAAARFGNNGSLDVFARIGCEPRQHTQFGPLAESRNWCWLLAGSRRHATNDRRLASMHRD
jgi:hypothetical protein